MERSISSSSEGMGSVGFVTGDEVSFEESGVAESGEEGAGREVGEGGVDVDMAPATRSGRAARPESVLEVPQPIAKVRTTHLKGGTGPSHD